MALADRLGRELEAGGLSEGARVISVRKLAEREGVSIPTAVSALRQLETQGRIVARPRSGWRVAPRSIPLPSSQPVPARPAPVSIRSLAREVFTLRDKPTVRLGAGIPQGDWLPRSDLDQALRLAAHRLGSEAHSYSNTPGSPELRERLARHLASKGVTVAANDIIVTAGATEALELALAAIARPGDVVAVESPCYFGYLMCLERLSLRAMELRTDPVVGLDIDAALESLDKNKVAAVIVSPSLHNPTGASIPLRDRRRLVAELAARGIPLVEDDTYGDLADRGLAPCKAFDGTGKVVYCGSASKTISPGWRLGWIVPGRWRDEVLSHRLERSLAGSLLYETALAEFLTGGRYERHLQRMRDRIDRSRSAIVARVASSFPAGTRMAGNNAGYTLWLELPAAVDAVRLMRMADAQGIGVAPGPVFSASLGYRNYVRLNVANDPTPRLLAAVDRLGRLAAQML
jgi:DNA-binding transcriptional MocR family regulator